MAKDIDLSIGAPGEPEVAAGVGDAVREQHPAGRGGRAPRRDSEPRPLAGVVDVEAVPAITVEQLRPLLTGASMMLGELVGDDDVPGHWVLTDAELDQLAPALVSIINRRPALRRAVQHSDEATIALVLAGYAGRNLDAGRKARVARAKLEAITDEGRPRETAGAPSRDGAGDARTTGVDPGRRHDGEVPGTPGRGMV